MSKSKISLELLMQLVKEFKDSILLNEELRDTDDYDRSKYVIEMSKAMGLAAGIANEATLLIGDVKVLVNQVSTGQDSLSKDSLSDILGAFAKVGSSNGGLGGSGTNGGTGTN